MIIETDVNFALIKHRVILFASVAVICLTLMSISVGYKSSLIDEKRLIERAIRIERNSIYEIVQNEAMIEKYQVPYTQLLDRQFLGEENRLTWIEQLERTSAWLKLPNLSYHIDPQQLINAARFPIPGSIKLRESSFSFESTLLHEGDLIDLLDGLAALPSGLFVVDSCELSKITELISSSSRNRFSAACEFFWYTASYKDGGGSYMSEEI